MPETRESPAAEPAADPGPKRVLSEAEKERMRNLNRSGKRKVPEESSELPADSGEMPVLLRDLWHVYCRPRGEDRTMGQKAFRKMAEQNPAAFLDRFHKADAAYQAEKREREERAAGGEKADGGVAAAVKLVDWLLREGEFGDE